MLINDAISSLERAERGAIEISVSVCCVVYSEPVLVADAAILAAAGKLYCSCVNPVRPEVLRNSENFGRENF